MTFSPEIILICLLLSGSHLQALECGADTLLVDEGKTTMASLSFVFLVLFRIVRALTLY